MPFAFEMRDLMEIDICLSKFVFLPVWCGALQQRIKFETGTPARHVFPFYLFSKTRLVLLRKYFAWWIR